MFVSFLLGFGAIVSCFSSSVIGVSFLSLLLYEGASLLLETSDSFGPSGFPSRFGCPLGRVRVLLGPLSHLDFKIPFADWSPFGTCPDFD